MNIPNWQVTEEGIQHLHHDGDSCSITSVNDRKVCVSCRETVPTVVLKLAENKGVSVVTTASPKDGKKAKKSVDVPVEDLKELTVEQTLTAEELIRQAQANPELLSALREQLGVSSDEKVTFEVIPAAMIFFPQGKPAKETRELLKSRGYTFRPGNKNGEGRNTWVGPLATLKGTPFEMA